MLSVEGLAVVITALSGLVTAVGLVLTNRSKQTVTNRKSDRRLLDRYEKRDEVSLLHIRAQNQRIIELGGTPLERPAELGPDWLFADDEQQKSPPKAVSS